MVLKLLKPIYGLKEATLFFWKRLLAIMKNMGHEQSIADPCKYFSRNKAGELVIWLSWMGNNLTVELPQVER